ncbi:hypothetical protein ACI2JR_25205 [Klebsiella sp. NPDC088457]
MKVLKHYNIQVGLSASGYIEIESKVLPEYNHGMVFIAATDGKHHAIALRCVDGVVVTPILQECIPDPELGKGDFMPKRCECD